MKLNLLFTASCKILSFGNPPLLASSPRASRPAHLSFLTALRSSRLAPRALLPAPRAPLRPNHRFQTFNKKGIEKNKTKVLIYFCEKLMKLNLLFTASCKILPFGNPPLLASSPRALLPAPRAPRPAPRSSLISHLSPLFAPCVLRPAHRSSLFAPCALRPACQRRKRLVDMSLCVKL